MGERGIYRYELRIPVLDNHLDRIDLDLQYSGYGLQLDRNKRSVKSNGPICLIYPSFICLPREPRISQRLVSLD